MLQVRTTAVCPKCKGEIVWYEDGKFTCQLCGKKCSSKEIIETYSDVFEIVTAITEKEFRDKIKQLDELSKRFSAVLAGYAPDGKGIGHLVIGWDDGYPVRLNMMVQELNEIFD